MLCRFFMSRSLLLVVSSAWLAGCAIVDDALSPRTYSINETADSVLNNSILLNILRASDSEPLNFVAIAKYTAGGQLGVNAQAGQFTYVAQVTHPGSQYGPNSVTGQVSNSFDLNVLETKDFYSGLLHNLDAGQTGAWFSQGLTRELVFYVLIGSIRTTAPDGAVYEYRNDPADDDWRKYSEKEQPEHNSAMCEPRWENNGTQFDDLRMWYGLHANDCRFQKFRFLVDLAVKYGLRIEAQTYPNPKWTKDSTTEPKTLSKATTCYDPAWFREFAHQSSIPGLKVCGDPKSIEARLFSIRGPGTLTGVELVIRSPFAMFQYLGRILATDSLQRVALKGRELENNDSADRAVLNVVSGSGPSCFAEAWYHGASYCVPMEHSENTKQIFTMLRSILATNIAATDLNSTPSIHVTP